jgi:hypothetical protein
VASAGNAERSAEQPGLSDFLGRQADQEHHADVVNPKMQRLRERVVMRDGYWSTGARDERADNQATDKSHTLNGLAMGTILVAT